MKAKKNNSWFTCLYDVDQTGIIPTEELEEMKREMTPAEIRQELYCDFAANASNKLISLDSINEAMSRELSEAEYKDLPKILGVDVARFGDDRSVMIRRQGLKVWEPKTRKEVDNMTFAGMLAQEIDDWMPDVVFIDAGRGEGVIDRLRQLGYKQVIEVPFGGKAILDTRYVNKRAEMWDSCRQWLEQGGDLPYMPELRQELSMPEYSFDGLNRIKLESKESIKDKTGYSPDLADALCLTFAFPVNNTRRNAFMRAKKLGLTRKYGKM